MTYDIAVIGGGLLGFRLPCRRPKSFLGFGSWYWRKNRGWRGTRRTQQRVIHSGVYYKEGSLKARLCVAGARAMVEFCTRHGIPHEVCGKLIVATNSEEAARLEDLLARGVANGLEGLRLLAREAMLEIEPHAGGVRALHVPSTGSRIMRR